MGLGGACPRWGQWQLMPGETGPAVALVLLVGKQDLSGAQLGLVLCISPLSL
jgi:hypothetical protein